MWKLIFYAKYGIINIILRFFSGYKKIGGQDMKKTAWAVIRTVLACACVAAFGFVGYYVLWAIRIAATWCMSKIDWIWEFVQNNVTAAALIVALVTVGSIVLEFAGSKIAKTKLYRTITSRFKKNSWGVFV